MSLFNQDHLAGQSLGAGLQLVQINAAGLISQVYGYRVRAGGMTSLCQYYNFPPQQIKYNESNIAILR